MLRAAATLWVVGALLCALLAPMALWLLLAATAAVGTVFLAFRHTVAFCVGWLLIAGSTLEMALGDWLGGSAYQTIIALVKAAELGLGLICLLRFGAVLDPLNPALAYGIIFAGGLVHGLYPGLTLNDSLRSLIGSAAPFIFCFSRVPLDWARGMIRMTCWIPALTVAAGVMLAAGGAIALAASHRIGLIALIGGFVGAVGTIAAGSWQSARYATRKQSSGGCGSSAGCGGCSQVCER